MSDLKLKVRITIYKENFEDGHDFGKGIYLLLKGIENSGSLNQTAKSMGMAYSRAWSILKQAEKEFDVILVERKGAKGSALTEEGRSFLHRYEEIESAAKKAAMEVFNKYWE